MFAAIEQSLAISGTDGCGDITGVVTPDLSDRR
jgi:hypothetical protein